MAYYKISQDSKISEENTDTALVFFEKAQKNILQDLESQKKTILDESPKVVFHPIQEAHMNILQAKQKKALREAKSFALAKNNNSSAQKYRDAANYFKKEAGLGFPKVYLDMLDALIESIALGNYKTNQKELEDMESFLEVLQQKGCAIEEQASDKISGYYCNLAYIYERNLGSDFLKNKKENSIEKIFSLYEKALKFEHPEAPIFYINALKNLDFENQRQNNFQKIEELLEIAQNLGYGERQGEPQKIKEIQKYLKDNLKKLGRNETFQALSPKKEGNQDFQNPPLKSSADQPLPEERKSSQKQNGQPSLEDFLNQATKHGTNYQKVLQTYEEGLKLFPEALQIYQGMIETYHSHKERLKEAAIQKMKNFCKEALGKAFIADVTRTQALDCLVFACKNQEILEILQAENPQTLTPALLLSLYNSQKELGKEEAHSTLDQLLNTTKDPISVDLYLDWIERKVQTVEDVDTLLVPLASTDKFIKVHNFQVDLKDFDRQTFWPNFLRKYLEEGKDSIVQRCCEKVEGLFLVGEFLKLKQKKNVTQLPYKAYQKYLSSSLGLDLPLREFRAPYLMQQCYLNFEKNLKEDAFSFGEEGVKLGEKCENLNGLKALVKVYLEKAQENEESSKWIAKVEGLKNKVEDPEWIEDKLEILNLKLSAKQKETKDEDLKAEMEKLKNKERAQHKILVSQSTRDRTATGRINELEEYISTLKNENGQLKSAIHNQAREIEDLEQQLFYLRGAISDAMKSCGITPEDVKRAKEKIKEKMTADGNEPPAE